MYRVEKPNNPSSNKYINFYRIPMTQWATEGMVNSTHWNENNDVKI